MTDVRPSPAAPTRACALGNATRFYDAIRPLFGGSMMTAQIAGIAAKVAAFGAARAPLSWLAYGLATSWWETGRRMTPVEEVGHGKGCAYGVPGCHAGQIAYGRGDVQLTWDQNYERADAELGLGGGLIADYRLALRPDISARIMVEGMTQGWFTGKGFADYLPATGRASLAAFTGARRIINGTDHAAQIAAVAMTFQDAIVAAGWA